MKLQKNIAVSDSGFIFNPATGESFSTNPIGLEIITMLRSGKSRQEICATITENYATDQQTADRDLHDLISMLKQYQLIDTNDDESN
jgi:hypothetical protein